MKATKGAKNESSQKGFKNLMGQFFSPVGYDINVLFPVLLLVGIGTVMVYSASSALALKKFGEDAFFLRRQAMFALVGLMALVVCRHIPFTVYRPLTYPFLLFSILLLVIVHVPGFGYSAGGANRWLRVGGFTFQPSEAARLALIIFIAYSLSKKGEMVKNFAIGFVPHVLVLSIFALLLFFQPDFGMVLIFTAITWIMMFAGGVRIFHLATPLVLVVPLLVGVMIRAPYRMERLMTFWDPWQYPKDGGYQVIHSLMAFGTGGIWGTGIGQSYQKLFYLPEPHTDFIFSIIGEEIGLLGVLFIEGLFLWVIWRGILIARRCKDRFGALVAAGITMALALSVSVNMGVALGLLPTKGLTLPFLSYGGTSLLVNMAAMGILMNIGGSTEK